MNLPNKLTITRIVISFFIIGILIFPFDTMGLSLPKIFIDESIVIDTKYLIAGVLFVIASITDFLDGYIARKQDLITDFGKMMDSIADKILVNSVLIILSAYGFIHPIIPVVIIVRDSIVNSMKMIIGKKGIVVAAIKTGKVKAFLLMVGIALTLFYNLPFELWNLRVSDFILIVAAVLSIVSAFQYYEMCKDYLKEKNNG